MDSGIEPHACFEISRIDFSMEAPRFLVLSVSDIVRLDVRLYASAVGC